MEILRPKTSQKLKLKLCIDCQNEKDSSFFPKWSRRCQRCISDLEETKMENPEQKENPLKRQCTYCEKEKDISCFTKGQTTCKECKKIRYRKNHYTKKYPENKELLQKIEANNWRPIVEKPLRILCKYCDTEKDISCFENGKGRKCKECIALCTRKVRYTKKYSENPELLQQIEANNWFSIKEKPTSKRVCQNCNTEKDNSCFEKQRKICKECRALCYRKGHYTKKYSDNQELLQQIKDNNWRPITDNVEEKTRICKFCDTDKDISCFKKNSRKCIECDKAWTKEYRLKNKKQSKKWYQDNKERIQKKLKEKAQEEKKSPSSGTKLCNYCNIEQDISCFRINGRRCIECERAAGRKYSRENKAKRKKWVSENKERMQELQSNHYQKNKVEINTNERERYKNDPAFRLKKNERRNLHRILTLRELGTKYRGVVFSIIKSWFEFCFTDEMCWENYGKYWQVDHVIPISRFDLTGEKQVNVCFNWKNIQPLTKAENMHKKANICSGEIDRHTQKLRQFFEKHNINEDLEGYLREYEEIIKIITK